MFNFLAITLEVPGSVSQAAEQIGEPGMVGNLLVILVFLVIVLIYGFLLDRHNMVINLFSLYIALLVVKFFPYNSWQLGDWAASWWGQIILLALIASVSSIILSMSHLFKVVYTTNFLIRWWQAVISAILYTGLLVSIILSVLPAKFLNQFSPSFLNLFTSDVAGFFWLTLPLLGLLLVKSRRRGPGRPAY
jgi:hypothetical protein